MKRVFIGVGHGGKDPGAVGYSKESESNLQMALGMKSMLEKYNILVAISRITEENDPLREEIKEANLFEPDLAVECHNNAGGANGFEVYRQTNGYAQKSLKLAECIEKQVVASGQKSRGVKTKLNSSGTDYFGWCREVRCPAVLCEGFFVDNKLDSLDYNTEAKLQDYGKIYALGVLDYLEILPKADLQRDYTVQVGAFESAEYAEKLYKKMESMGYFVFLKQNILMKICIGKFATKQEAQLTADELRKKGIEGFVTMF